MCVEALDVALLPDDVPDVVVLVSEVCVFSCGIGSSSARPYASSDARLITAVLEFFASGHKKGDEIGLIRRRDL